MTRRKPAPLPMPDADIVVQSPRSFRMSRTLVALMLREMSTTYGRTAFGYLWAIVEPAAGILLLTMVFSLALRSPQLGVNFPLFYATGLMPFAAYTTISNKVANSLQFSKPLMAFPAVTFVDALLARLLLNALTQTMVIVVVVGLIIVIYQLDVDINFGEAALAVAMAIMLGFGIGTLNCFLFQKFPAWSQVWSILTRPLLFISCVFYLFDSVPSPYGDWLWFNPLVHIIGMFRRGIYATYPADYVSVLYVMSLSMGTLFFGLLLLKRYHGDLLNR